LIDYLMTTNT